MSTREVVDPKMYAQGILERIETLDNEIKLLQRKVDAQRNFIFRHSGRPRMKLTADLNGEIHGKGQIYKWNEVEIQKFLDSCYDVEQKEAERDEIIEKIEKIRDRKRRKIVFLRFVKRLKWFIIADTLNISVRNAYNILDKALIDFYVIVSTSNTGKTKTNKQ